MHKEQREQVERRGRRIAPYIATGWGLRAGYAAIPRITGLATFYHGTAEKHVPSILKRGLRAGHAGITPGSTASMGLSKEFLEGLRGKVYISPSRLVAASHAAGNEAHLTGIPAAKRSPFDKSLVRGLFTGKTGKYGRILKGALPYRTMRAFGGDPEVVMRLLDEYVFMPDQRMAIRAGGGIPLFSTTPVNVDKITKDGLNVLRDYSLAKSKAEAAGRTLSATETHRILSRHGKWHKASDLKLLDQSLKKARRYSLFTKGSIAPHYFKDSSSYPGYMKLMAKNFKGYLSKYPGRFASGLGLLAGGALLTGWGARTLYNRFRSTPETPPELPHRPFSGVNWGKVGLTGLGAAGLGAGLGYYMEGRRGALIGSGLGLGGTALMSGVPHLYNNFREPEL